MTRGGVYLRGKIWWVRYYHKGKERAETTHSTDKADAERLLARRLGEIGADKAGVRRWLGPEAERVLVTDLIDDFIVAFVLSKKRSLKAVQYQVKPLLASFDRERVREIDTARLRRYVQERTRAGKAPGTIRVELAWLRRAFNMAHEEGRIGQVPHFPTIEVDNARQGFFEQGDFEAVVAQLPEYLRDVARFAQLTGWRKEEVLGLAWAEVDLLGRVIKLGPSRSKNKRGRTLVLVGDLWDIIQRRWEERIYKPGGTVDLTWWVFHRNGEPIKSMREAWNGACKRAGVQGMLFHDLRRTAVRNLMRAGVPQGHAMQITGHKSLSVFQRYDIVDEQDIRLAQEKMQAYLKAEGQERKIIPLEGANG